MSERVDIFTQDQRDYLAGLIAGTLSGTFVFEPAKLGLLMSCIRDVAKAKPTYAIQGLKQWILTDPRAKEILQTAMIQAGMKFEAMSEAVKRQKET